MEDFMFDELNYLVINDEVILMSIFLSYPTQYSSDMCIDKNFVVKYKGVKYFVDYLATDPTGEKFAYLTPMWKHPTTKKI